MLASSMSTIATGTADCGGRGMQRLQLVEHLEPEGLDDRRVEDVEGNEQQDEQRADQAGRQVDATDETRVWTARTFASRKAFRPHESVSLRDATTVDGGMAL